MEIVPEGLREKSRKKLVLFFLLHQLIGTWGVILAAPWVLVLFSDLVGLFGWVIHTTKVQWILTQTPYFPVQISLALFLGWFLACNIGQRPMLWVWVLPFVFLGSVFVAFPAIGQLLIPQYAYLGSQSRLSHFFGWGCRPVNRCLEQLIITLPFYTSTAYSIGAFLAQKMRKSSKFIEFMKAIDKKRAFFFVGVPFICLYAALAWRAAAQYPYLRTGLGVGFYLGVVLIQSVFVTMLFMSTISLVGRRWSLGRFFLRTSG